MSNTSYLEDSKLSTEKLGALLSPEGRLSLSLSHYEYRPQQLQMLYDIIDTYNRHGIALVEAGTGTGKSVAYLIPAIAAALKNHERTVISTNTINLQEQLLHKDLPMVAKSLGVDLKAVIAKGMGNYVCLRKIQGFHEEFPGFSEKDNEQIEAIAAWAYTTEDGSLSELPIHPRQGVWEQANADPESCDRRKCPYYKDCHYFKARKNAADANLVIVNHSLLFADLAQRAADENYTDTSILPPYQHLILDEAHNIEEIATDFFAARVSRIEIMRIVGNISSDKSRTNKGKLQQLSSRMIQHFGIEADSVAAKTLNRINIDLAGIRHTLLQQLHDAFEELDTFFCQYANTEHEEYKLRMLHEVYETAQWKQQVHPKIRQYLATAFSYCHTVSGVLQDLEDVKDEAFNMQTSTLRLELQGLLSKLTQGTKTLEKFLSCPQDKNSVRWLECRKQKGFENIHLVETHLDLSEQLAANLFSHFQAIILCSATLSTNQQFSFIKSRLGIDSKVLGHRHLNERIYPSPFDYSKQTLFAVPTDLPDPNHPQFLAQASQFIQNLIEAADGNTFVLFTSYAMLEICHRKLKQWLDANRFPVFKQGEADRKTLLQQFKKANRSVLFGTSSFWEGVDVVGDDLRCVILAKLPFKVPTEPIIQARTEAIEQQGGDPFMEYTIPHAIVKFKQGFGRLIRNKKDRGCVICLDNRIVTKKYGKMFLNSIPECSRILEPGNRILEEMQKFYGIGKRLQIAPVKK